MKGLGPVLSQRPEGPSFGLGTTFLAPGLILKRAGKGRADLFNLVVQPGVELKIPHIQVNQFLHNLLPSTVDGEAPREELGLG